MPGMDPVYAMRRQTLARSAAQALATAVTCSGADPGSVAQPPFSTYSPCAHVSVFLSAARFAIVSGAP